MELKSCSTQKDVREAFRTLSKTLKETYDRILDSVPQPNQSYIRAALHWIACSARPLSLDELAVAAVIDPAVAKPNGSENQIFGGGETIHKMLSKLIDVHKVEHVSLGDILRQKPRSNLDAFDNLSRACENLKHPGPTIVRFSHSSVRDYLLQRHDDTVVSRSFSFSEDMAHRFITKSCLAYIQKMFETASVGNKVYGGSWACLLMYLASYWHTHSARLPDEESGSLAHLFNEPLAVRFLLMATDECTRYSSRDMLGLKDFKMKPLSPEQKLQYAACSGFSCVDDGILASNPDLDVDASSELVGTALSAACERRHWQIADALLKRGADPNKHDEREFPLFPASMHGADDIVQELINHGANVNIECDIEGENTPLEVAIEASHPSTVELLLINGADPEFPCGYETPMSVAARHGRHECMGLLLKHGASLKVPNMDFPSLLELASASGSVETVKLLLTQGLDVDEENCLMPLSEDRMLPACTYRFNYPGICIKEPTPSCYVEHVSYGSPMHAAAAYSFLQNP